MPRGVRRSPLEKLQDELKETHNTIEQYNNCLNTLKVKETELKQKIELEKFKDISELLNQNDMSIEDLKEMLEANIPNMTVLEGKQGA